MPYPLICTFAPEVSGLRGAANIAASGDLLFVPAPDEYALSVWRVMPRRALLARLRFIR